MAAEGIVPPIVIDVEGTAKSFDATVAEVKAMALELYKSGVVVPIKADIAPFIAAVEAARALAEKPVSAAYTLDTRPALAQLLALRAAASMIADEGRIFLILDAARRLNPGSAAAALGAGLGGSGGGRSGIPYIWANSSDGGAGGPGGSTGGGRGSPWFDAWLASMVGGGGGGKGNGPSLAELLGYSGRGRGRFGWTRAFPAFGSIAGMAGFGLEHAATTALGLAGSAVGGLLGGGLLAYGGLGVTGVGLGTDLAGAGQAAGDIRQYGQLTAAMAKAAAVYGKSSKEYQAALYDYKQWAQDLSVATVSAIASTSATASAFHALFDKVTGEAETYGAKIIQEVMTAGAPYLPVIGKFAAENMQIIQKALLPLEIWLDGPGLRIFTELEEKFQQDLPTSMHAFDEAVEFAIRTLGLLAPMTGGLTRDLNRLFTNANTTGWDKWVTDVDTLVGLFRLWTQFFKLLIEDVALIFSHGVGLGSGIIKELTGYLETFHSVLEKSLDPGKGGNLSALFAAHKQEVLQLIGVIVGLGRAFSNMYLIAAPFLTEIVTLLLRIIDGALRLVNAIPGGADVLGLLLLSTRLRIFSGLWSSLWPTMGSLAVNVMKVVAAKFAVFIGLEETALKILGSMKGAGSGLGSVASDAEGTGSSGLLAGLSGSAASVAPVALALAGILGTLYAAHRIGTVTASVVQSLTHGVQNLSASNSLPVLESNLSQVNSRMQSMAQHAPTLWSSIFPSSSRWAAAIDLIKAKLTDKTDILAYQANIGSFGKSLGLTTSQVDGLANALGVKLAKVPTFGPAHILAVTAMRAGLQKLDSQAQTTTSGLLDMSTGSGESMGQVAADIASMSQSASASLSQFTQQLATGNNATQIAQWYQKQLSTMQNFGANIRKAIEDGYSPAYIKNILAQGPATAAPELQALVSGSSTAITRLVTATQMALQQQGQDVANEITIEAQGVKARGTEMGNALPVALALATAAAGKNADAQIGSVLAFYHLNWGQVQNLAGEYGSALPAAVLAQIGAAYAAGHKLGVNFLLGLQGGINAESSLTAQIAQGATVLVSKAAHNGVHAASPSKDMIDLGRYMMQGLAIGITGNASLPVQAMRAVMSTLKATPFGAPASHGGGGGGSYMNVQANFTIYAPGGNPGAIKNAISGGAADRFAEHVLISMRAGAGAVNG